MEERRKQKRVQRIDAIPRLGPMRLTELTTQLKRDIAGQSERCRQRVKAAVAPGFRVSMAQACEEAIRAHDAIGVLLRELLACERARQFRIRPDGEALGAYMWRRSAPRLAGKLLWGQALVPHRGQGQTRKPGSRKDGG